MVYLEHFTEHPLDVIQQIIRFKFHHYQSK